MPTNPRITIYRTTEEWAEIGKQVKDRGKKKVSSYVSSEISKIKEAFIKNPESVTLGKGGKKKVNQFRVEYTTYLILKEIAEKMNKPVDCIIDDLIIVPLLSPKL